MPSPSRRRSVGRSRCTYSGKPYPQGHFGALLQDMLRDEVLTSPPLFDRKKSWESSMVCIPSMKVQVWRMTGTDDDSQCIRPRSFSTLFLSFIIGECNVQIDCDRYSS